MDELTQEQETALADCLRAMEESADLDACLARHPQHAETLRPYLELHAGLLAQETPAPPAAAFDAGREALLSTVGQPEARESRSRWGLLGTAWNRLGSPLARSAAVGVALVLVAGAALGASAGAGLEPARDVLSTLNIVSGGPSDEAGDTEPIAQGEPDTPNAGEGAGNADDGINNAPDVAGTGEDHADEAADDGGGNAEVVVPSDPEGPPLEVPQVGLCIAEGRIPETVELPDEVLTRVPDVGDCVPQGLLELAPDGRTCVPRHVADRLPDQFPHSPDDINLCAAPTDEPTAEPANAPSETSGAPESSAPPEAVGEGKSVGVSALPHAPNIPSKLSAVAELPAATPLP